MKEDQTYSNQNKHLYCEEIDQKCQQMILKQYNDAIEVAFNIKKKRIFKKKRRQQQILVRPNTYSLLNQNRIFCLYGGLFLPCDFAYEAKNLWAERQNIKLGYRPLQSIEKKKNYSIVEFQCNFKGLEQFDFLINIYMNKGKQDYYNLAQVLKQFQHNIQIWKKQAQLLAPMRLKNYEEYHSEYQSFIKECLNKVDELDQSKFYLFGFIFYNYETENIEQRTVGFSKGFLSLLGTDQDQFNNITLRSGDSNYYSGDTFLNAIAISLLPFACKDVIFQKSVADTVIFSYDGFQIPCKEIRSYYLPENFNQINFFEIGFGLVEYDISITMLQQLLTLRARKYYIEQNKELELCCDQTFEYSMNSQIFIEKYYPDAITNEFLRCKYQHIDEVNQKTNNLQVVTSVSSKQTNSFCNDDLSEISFNNLYQSTTLKDSTKSTIQGNKSSFLQIPQKNNINKIITPENFQILIQQNFQQQLNNVENQQFIEMGINQGLGYSQSLEQNLNIEDQSIQFKKDISSIDQSDQLGFSQNLQQQQAEMQIEPFMYFENGCQSEQEQLKQIKLLPQKGLDMMFQQSDNDLNNNYLFLQLKNNEKEVFMLKNSLKNPQLQQENDVQFNYVEFVSDYNKQQKINHF
ncbi:hypothetical protein TTHERM_00727570 (macronuclear) [Tetrahymena thermophila SB210]|uniref:Uncharacterized protein n=1 Tax=Tetrahymena thermophila (strain SB210) TaxID=312017 RepID=I7MH06_TETTS|nr:hypothetical protein TTHERM_00727570 [Tetrahymena thermophila SB210]EAS02397.3 hypothetical protein TTHERM_00727570 [Tetrahymena thermophila SB210]|eukprot:XP_001022642.3 hypothetical protein TTHERM_00727570 [Tetrahymena thermophila SB210]